MKTIFKIAIIITLLLGTKGISQTKQELLRQIDSLLTNNNQHNSINGNVLVIQNSEVLYEKSFGFAEPNRKIKLNKESKFLIGSIYKEFPAVAIMQLSEQGLINVEDNVDKYIPELPSWSKEISIKNLLQYSSGLPDIQTKKYPQEKIITTKDILSDLLNIPNLIYKPGTDYLYTNYSPLLLMKIVEKVSGKSFNEYSKTFLFNSENINIKTQYPYIEKEHLALSFNKEYVPDSFKLEIPFLFVSNSYGLYDWFKRIDENSLISEKSKLFLGKTANILSDKSMQSSFGKLYTTKLTNSSEISVLEHTHDGSFGNFKCIARRFTLENITIIILTNQNTNNVYEISEELYKLVIKKKK
jgi:hypothetical protein